MTDTKKWLGHTTTRFSVKRCLGSMNTRKNKTQRYTQLTVGVLVREFVPKKHRVNNRRINNSHCGFKPSNWI